MSILSIPFCAKWMKGLTLFKSPVFNCFRANIVFGSSCLGTRTLIDFKEALKESLEADLI